MELKNERRVFTEQSTIGDLYVDGRKQCLILEDKVREVADVPVAAWKVPGKTAIPRGRYRVQFTFSRRFNRVMPQLINVPGFEGIRIHSGNIAADTEGCPLTGYDEHKDLVGRSRDAFNDLEKLMQAADARKEEIWFEVS